MSLPGFTAEVLVGKPSALAGLMATPGPLVQSAGERAPEQTSADSVVPAACCNVFPPGTGIKTPSSCFDVNDDLGEFVCWLVGLSQGGSFVQPGSCSQNPFCSPDPCQTCTNCHSTWIGWCFCNGKNCGWGSPCCG